MSIHIGDRRVAPRHIVRLGFRVLIMLSNTSTAGKGDMLTLMGYTRDLSETGLALIVSSKSIDGRFLSGESGEMGIVLTLPTGAVEVTAVPARHERLEVGQGYLIGAHITKMSEGDRVRYVDYLKTLA